MRIRALRGAEASQTIAAAANKALARNEVEAENAANRFRLLFLRAVGVLALVNASPVERATNEYNFGALAVAYFYGGAVFAFLKSRGYHPALKYATSFTDITIVHARYNPVIARGVIPDSAGT